MMKLLLLVAVVLAVVWLVRAGARSGSAGSAQPSPQPPRQQDMVQCPVCSVHLPRSDALPGPDGRLYCCAEHRQRAEA